MNQKTTKTFIFLYSFFLIGSLSTIALLNFKIDPYQYYRYDSKQTLSSNDRYQVAGFVKNFDYNQVVIGTSMTQNFSLEYLKKKFGTNPIRLSLTGATIQEQSIVLKAAIKTGKVKHVIWGLDKCYLKYTPGKFPKTFPIHLYDEQKIKGGIQYLFNKVVFEDSFRALTRKVISKNNVHQQTLEDYKNWFKEFTFSKDIILKQYNDIMNTRSLLPKTVTDPEQTKRLEKEKQEMLHNFKQDIVNIIKKNPNIHFILFFPPNSLAFIKLSFLNNLENQNFYAQIREVIMKELITYKNVSFFDFETYIPIIANLDNYKDFYHYSEKINQKMVDMFLSETHKVTNKNITTLQKQFYYLPQKEFY